jgi:hypothetical protein
MTWYRGAFVTLNQVLTQIGMDEAAATGHEVDTTNTINRLEDGEQLLLKELILDVSDEIAQQWQRTFVPFLHTYSVYPSMTAWTDWRYERGILRFYLQNLEYADLLSLSSVEFDDTAQSASYYRLEGGTPYEAITFDASGVTLPSNSSFSSKAEFAGIWGYHQNYAQAWKAIGTLQSALNDSATSFVATALTVGSFEVYQYLKIDSEFLLVTDIVTDSPYTITVERGVRGTTAASHLISASIAAYQQMPEVTKAARRRVINLMQKRGELASLVQIGESTFETSPETINLSIPKRYVPVKSI